MKEVKSPKRPLIYYYAITLVILILFNFLVLPLLGDTVKEVDYGTFMTMIEEKNIGKVQVEDSEIIFTDKSGENIYQTGAMDDPTLT